METGILEEVIEAFSFNTKSIERELRYLEEENKVLCQFLKDVDGLTKVSLWKHFKCWVATKRLHMIEEKKKEAEAKLDYYLIAEQGLIMRVYDPAINCLEMVIKQFRYDTRFYYSALTHNHICWIENLRNQLIDLSKKEKKGDF